jgi:hypothetical protein
LSDSFGSLTYFNQTVISRISDTPNVFDHLQMAFVASDHDLTLVSDDRNTAIITNYM